MTCSGRDDGTGRRSGLKIRRWQHRGGSIPPPGTSRSGARQPKAKEDPMTDPAPQRDLARVVLAVLLIFMLIAASFWVLRPFLLAIVWASMIAVATWPLMLKLQARLHSRALAVLIMSATMVLVFV